MVSNFRDNLILLFFKESKGGYIIFDLLRLLSISQEFLENRIDLLIEKELLYVDERLSYQATNAGLDFLAKNKFDRVNLFELMNEVYIEKHDSFKNTNLNTFDVFVPKNFKNVVYSKKELDGLF